MNDLTARLLAEIERREGPLSTVNRLAGRDGPESVHRQLAYLAALREIVELHREYVSAQGGMFCNICGAGWTGRAHKTLMSIAEALGVAVDE